MTRNYGISTLSLPSPVSAGCVRLRNRITGVIMECPSNYIPHDPSKWERLS